MYYFDPLYLIFMVPAFIICLIAQAQVNSKYKKFSKVGNIRGVTGRQAAEAILNANGIFNVRIEPISGKMTDHYDPRNNVIRLSEGVYNSCSIAAVGIAAHEAGHAVQYDRQYFPITVRSAIIPVCNIGSQAGMIMIVIGMVLSNFYYSGTIINLGLIFFSLTVLLQLVTLPVEFNASRRALESIKSMSLLEGNEYVGARKMLTAAAMTYVAALVTSIMQLLYLLARTSNRRK